MPTRITHTSLIALLLLLLPTLASGLDMRRWDADVAMVHEKVLEPIGKREQLENDHEGPERYLGWLLEGLKSVQREMDADTYLIMREAALTTGEQLHVAMDIFCREDVEHCRERNEWALVEKSFSLKLDFVRNLMAIMD